MSTISGVSSSSDPWATMKAHRSQMQAKMFAKVDTDGSGGVGQAELTTMLNDISQKAGVSLDGDTAETFSQMDSNADGSLSSEELGQGMQSLMPPPPSTMDFAQMRSADGSGGSQGSQDDLFAKVDTNGDGSVNETELQALTNKIKADTGQDAGDMFAKLDSDGDGQLTPSELAAGRPPGGPQGAGSNRGADGPKGPGGPPPAGGAGAAGKSEASSAKTYDTLDTNQDGTVSELERLAGAIKDLATANKSDSKTASTSLVDVAKLAQQMYAQIAASLSGPSSNTLSVSA